MKKISIGLMFLFTVMIFTQSAIATEDQHTQAAIVIKLQPTRTMSNKLLGLCIALSFTKQSPKPLYDGVRIIADILPSDHTKTLWGFKNGDGVTQSNLPVHDVIIENETYSYIQAKDERQENGMFTLYPQRSDPASYLLKGVFYAQGHLFVINEILYINEEKTFYSTPLSREDN